MGRKLKLLGVACVAVLALTAVSASGAMAASQLTTGGTGTIKLEGTQVVATPPVLILAGTELKCSASTLIGSVAAGTVTEATLSPTYSGCTFGGLGEKVTPHSCTFTITNTATANTYNVDVTNCPSTAPLEIKVTSTGCIVKVENQSPTGDVTATNIAGSPDDVQMMLAVTGIVTNGNSSCPANVIGPHNTGALTGEYTVRAFNSGGTQVGLTSD